MQANKLNHRKPGKGKVLCFPHRSGLQKPSSYYCVLTQYLIRSVAQRLIKYLQVTFS